MKNKTDYQSLTDEQLIVLCKNNDKKAREYLLNRYFVLASKIVFKSVKQERDDVVQECMISLDKAIDLFDGEHVFNIYAKACIKNCITAYKRKCNSNKNKPFINSLSLSGKDGDDEDKTDIIADVGFSPEDECINNESVEELKDKITLALSAYEFNILNLYLKGYSYGEIAITLNKEDKSINNAMQRIRKKIEGLTEK